MRPHPLLALLALAACVEQEPEPSGAALFREHCASCHGPDGRGGGAASAALDRAPPDLTQISRRNGGTFPRNRVMSIIDGYTRGTHSGRLMPEFGEMDLGPTVIIEDVPGVGTPVPVRLLALADYLESIQR